MNGYASFRRRESVSGMIRSGIWRIQSRDYRREIEGTKGPTLAAVLEERNKHVVF